MERGRTGISDSSDSDITKTTARETWWTESRQIEMTVVTVTFLRKLLEGPWRTGRGQVTVEVVKVTIKHDC